MERKFKLGDKVVIHPSTLNSTKWHGVPGTITDFRDGYIFLSHDPDVLRKHGLPISHASGKTSGWLKESLVPTFRLTIRVPGDII